LNCGVGQCVPSLNNKIPLFVILDLIQNPVLVSGVSPPWLEHNLCQIYSCQVRRPDSGKFAFSHRLIRDYIKDMDQTRKPTP